MHQNIQEHFLKRFESASDDETLAQLIAKHVVKPVSKEAATEAFERLRRNGGGKIVPSLAICVVALKEAASTSDRAAPRSFAPEAPKPARTPDEIQRITAHLAKFWKSMGGKPQWLRRRSEQDFRTKEQLKIEEAKLEALKGQPVPKPSPELIAKLTPTHPEERAA